MKTDFFSKKSGCLRHALLPLVLLLSACAANPRVVEAEPRHTATTAAPQTAVQSAASQKPAPVEAQQPAPTPQSETLPKKSKHNVEED